MTSTRPTARQEIIDTAAENGWTASNGAAYVEITRGDVHVAVWFDRRGAVRSAIRRAGQRTERPDTDKRAAVLGWLTVVRCARCSAEIPAGMVNELCPASRGTGPHLPAAGPEETAASTARFGPIEQATPERTDRVSLVKRNALSGIDREARRRRLAHLRVRANSDRAVARRIIRRNDLVALAHFWDRYPTVWHMQDRADTGEAPTVSVVKGYAPNPRRRRFMNGMWHVLGENGYWHPLHDETDPRTGDRSFDGTVEDAPILLKGRRGVP